MYIYVCSVYILYIYYIYTHIYKQCTNKTCCTAQGTLPIFFITYMGKEAEEE